MPMALEGIRVLDMSRLAPGPYCSMILGDLGAEVIRIESADPKATVEGMLDQSPEVVEMFRAYNPHGRNKKSIVLDLKQEAGREVFYRLSTGADVVLEEFQPGVVKRLGVDYETIRKINPKIVYCSLTGYGQDGPYSQLPGHDINYIGTAGALSIIKDREGWPVVPSNLLADMAGGGMHAALSILAALVARSLHGVGQYVDCAMTDGVVNLMHFEYMSSTLRRGRALGDTASYGAYETKDGTLISIGNVEPWFWANFCKAMGRDDFIALQGKPDKQEEIRAFLREAFKERTRDEWFEYFKDKNVCVAPVYTLEEAQEDPHLRQRDMFVELDHPKFGRIRQVGVSVKLSETPGKVHSTGPLPGQNTDALLKEVGYTDEETQELRNSRAVA